MIDATVEQTTFAFPKLMKNETSGEIVLFKADKNGTVIASGDETRVGLANTNFTMTPFVDLVDGITLQNVPE